MIFRQTRIFRGFTLVELALVIVVMGMMLGVMLIPARDSFLRNDIRDTRENLQKAQQALLAYVAYNRTDRRTLLGFRDRQEIPDGRPYFPCPDLDGDGLEDRNMLMPDDITISAVSLTMQSAPDGENARNGACVRNKGLLPWRTIGAPDSDKWGNFFTYRVDPNFSHAGLGFGQRTRAETADTFAMLAPDGEIPHDFYPKRGGARGTDAPAVICLTHDCMENAQSRIAADKMDFLQNIKAGLTAIHPYSVGRRKYEPGDLVDAPVFVIVSHGRNRLGGVSADTGQCVEIQNEEDGGNPYELQNAFYAATNPPHPLTARGCHTPHIFTSPTDGSWLNEAVFVSRPLSAGAAADKESDMDDILIWMLSGELMQRLTAARIMPAPELEFLPE